MKQLEHELIDLITHFPEMTGAEFQVICLRVAEGYFPTSELVEYVPVQEVVDEIAAGLKKHLILPLQEKRGSSNGGGVLQKIPFLF